MCNSGKQIVLSGERKAEEMKILYSLIMECECNVTSVEMFEPECDQYIPILKVKEKNLNTKETLFTEEIYDYIISGCEGSFRILLGRFHKVIAVAKLENRESVNLEWVKDCLEKSMG